MKSFGSIQIIPRWQWSGPNQVGSKHKRGFVGFPVNKTQTANVAAFHNLIL